MIDVNLSGTFLPSQAFARTLSIRAERVESSISPLPSAWWQLHIGQRTPRRSTGVVGLTKQMALELGERGVRVNAVAPGVIRTPLTESYFHDPAKEQAVLALHAVGRVGSPDEVAAAILFLADQANDFFTGSVLTVDGGWTSGMKF